MGFVEAVRRRLTARHCSNKVSDRMLALARHAPGSHGANRSSPRGRRLRSFHRGGAGAGRRLPAKTLVTSAIQRWTSRWGTAARSSGRSPCGIWTLAAPSWRWSRDRARDRACGAGRRLRRYARDGCAARATGHPIQRDPARVTSPLPPVCALTFRETRPVAMIHE